jgi:hypothetical protein
MATLNIEGRKVTVDDSFLKLSPEEQQHTVDEIASSLTPAAPDIGENRESAVAALRGIPIAGAYVDKATAALNALAQPLTETGLSNAGTFGERMAENERTIRAATDAYEKSHPIGTTVGKIALGAAATAPLAAAAPALFGATGGIVRQMGVGALSNAAIGGTDAAVRGQDVGSGVALGGALGAAAPVAATIASPFISNIMSRLVSPEGFANRQVARAIIESGQTPDQIANALKQAQAEGQGAFNVADALGNSGQRMLSSVARAPGEGRSAAVEALESRQAGQGRRVANALAEGFEAPETAAQTEARLTAARSAAADAEYGAVRSNGGQVDVVPTIDNLDRVIGTGSGQNLQTPNDSIESVLRTFRERLSRVNPDDFEAVQRIRSDMADAAQNAKQNGYGNRARLIGNAVRVLDRSMEKASSGFKQANANFAQASKNIEAVQTGRDAFMRGRSEDTIPAFQKLTPEGQAAYRAGYVDPAIGQTQGAAIGVNKARPFANDAFRTEAEAMAPGNELMQRRLGREMQMFETRNAALGGSKTADNLADQAALGVDPAVVLHALHGNYVGALHSLGSKLANGWNGNSPRVRAAIADLLLKNGANAADLQQLVDKAIRQVEVVQSMANAFRSAPAVAAVTTNTKSKPKSPSYFAARY